MHTESPAAEPSAAVDRALTVHNGRIELERTDGRCTVRFVGEIDIAFSRDEFDELTAAVRSSGQPVHVDCSRVTFFSAEGIRMLVQLRSAAVDNRLAGLATSRALNRLGRAYPLDELRSPPT